MLLPEGHPWSLAPFWHGAMTSSLVVRSSIVLMFLSQFLFETFSVPPQVYPTKYSLPITYYYMVMTFLSWLWNIIYYDKYVPKINNVQVTCHQIPFGAIFCVLGTFGFIGVSHGLHDIFPFCPSTPAFCNIYSCTLLDIYQK